jgi:phosphoserine phosphatase
VIAIGDGIVDINMFDKAGLGLAFNALEKVQKHANVIPNDISNLLNYL